ncbi:MAG: IS1595 family transposase [Acidimicrobiia bacterium]
MEHFNLGTLSAKITDEASAYELLEQMRWDGKPVCPHCGSVAKHYFLNPQNGGRKTRTGNVSPRRVWKCKDCRKQFSALTGTIMEGSKVKVGTWLHVMYRMCSSKNGISSREVQRDYGISMEAAWFLTHRIREAMKRDPIAGMLRGTIVADETWIGPNPKNFRKGKRFQANHAKGEHKTPVLSLVNHETGEVRSEVVRDVTASSLRSVIEREVDLPATVLHTDESTPYVRIGWKAAGHETVTHSQSNYVSATGATTNHAEGYFAQLKRSLDGTFHAVSREHLHRYLAQFDYLYSTRKLSDSERMARLMGQTRGRRLTYRPMIGKA